MPIITGAGNVTVTVQVCFNQDPNDPTPPVAVWTDITQRCSNLTITRGRQYELDKVEPGTFTVTVNNDDGALTPGNTSSSFYPGVVLYRQIQVVVNYQSGNHYLFTGFVTQWPQSYNSAGQRPSTTLVAVDALGLLALITMNGWGRDTYKVLGASVLYPLNDAAGSTMFGASIGAVLPGRTIGSPGTVTPGVAFDAAMPGFSGQTYTALSNSAGPPYPGASITFPQQILPTAGAFTVSFWFNFTAAPSVVSTLFIARDRDAHGAEATTSQIWVNRYGDGTMGITGRNYDATNGVSYNSATSATMGDGAWHLLGISLSADRKTLRYAIDGGTAATVVSSTTAMGFPLSLMDLGLGGDSYRTSGGATLGSQSAFTGSLANLAVFPADLCSDPTNPLLTLFSAGRTAFAGESTGARAKRIATFAGFGAQFISY